MDPCIELIFDDGCPNVDAWRAVLARAIRELGLALRWQEWDRADPGAPAYTATCASPSVLVDGRDLSPTPRTDGCACRLYHDSGGGVVGVLPYSVVLEAVRAAERCSRSRRQNGSVRRIGGPAFAG